MVNAKKDKGEPAPILREQIPGPVWGRGWGVLGLGFVVFMAVWCQPVWCQPFITERPTMPRPATLSAGNLAEFVPGQIVVLFRKGVTGDRIQDINESQGTTALKVVPNLKIYLLRPRKGVSPLEAARRYRKFPEVLAADPNFVVRAVVDPEFNQQWYFANTGSNPGNRWDNLGFIDSDIDAPKGWLVNMGAPNIKIAILDSGIDTAPLPTHPDLTNKVVASANFTSSSSWADVLDHGTHVAGLAAAWINGQFIQGTCPLCSLINAKVIDDNNVGNLFALQQGIYWAVATAGANILNASLSGQGSCPTTLQPVIDWAVLTQGRIFVAAAGNSGSNLNSNPAWPAVCNNVVTVAATDARDDRAGFSNYGAPIVEIAAPGLDVLSLKTTLLGGGTVRKDGTSMAAPIVSGSLGVIWAKMGFPSTPNNAVVSQMQTTADKIDGTAGYPGYGTNINSWQYGRLNLCKALGVQDCDPLIKKPFVISAPACPPGGGVVTLDLSTGTTNGIQDPFGTQDGKWRVFQEPSSTHGQLPVLYPIRFYPAFSTNPAGVPWAASPAGANWILPLSSPVVQTGGFWHVSSKGFYKYRAQFKLPPGTYTSVSLAGLHAGDDIGKLFLNGNLIAMGGNFGSLTPFNYSSSSGLGFFAVGLNELVGEVENGTAITGLLVKAELQATCAQGIDLAITKRTLNTPWHVGGPFSFSILVQNLGPGPITSGVITMTDVLPTNLQVTSVAQGGSLWNCSVTGANPPATVTCTWDASLQAVPPGSLPFINITGNVVNAGTKKNCAAVSHSGDANPTNNKSCVKFKI